MLNLRLRRPRMYLLNLVGIRPQYLWMYLWNQRKTFYFHLQNPWESHPYLFKMIVPLLLQVHRQRLVHLPYELVM